MFLILNFMNKKGKQSENIALILEDSEKNKSSVELLCQLSNTSDCPEIFLYLKNKIELEKLEKARNEWGEWFSFLGWWFGKLLIWGALIGGVAGAYLGGKSAIDPITYCLVGAALYFALVQIFTPIRLSWIKNNLEKDCELIRQEQSDIIDRLQKNAKM
jgi:hypothetical protein